MTSRSGVPWRTSLPSVPTISASRPWQRGRSSSCARVAATALTAQAANANSSTTRMAPRKRLTRAESYSGAADQLLVDELVSAVAAELAPEPGALEAAERQLRAVGPDQVHVDHPGFDLVGDAVGLLFVGAHHIGAEAERRLVGELDRLLLGANAVDLGHRPEELFLGGLVAGLDPGEDRRFEVVAVAFAPDQHLGAVLDRLLHLLLQPVGRHLRGERADFGVLGGRVARFRRFQLLAELPEEVVVELVDGDEALGCFAGLPGVVEPGFGRRRRRLVHVLGAEQDERIGATELEHDLLQVLASGRGDGGTGALGASHR